MKKRKKSNAVGMLLLGLGALFVSKRKLAVVVFFAVGIALTLMIFNIMSYPGLIPAVTMAVVALVAWQVAWGGEPFFKPFVQKLAMATLAFALFAVVFPKSAGALLRTPPRIDNAVEQLIEPKPTPSPKSGASPTTSTTSTPVTPQTLALRCESEVENLPLPSARRFVVELPADGCLTTAFLNEGKLSRFGDTIGFDALEGATVTAVFHLGDGRVAEVPVDARRIDKRAVGRWSAFQFRNDEPTKPAKLRVWYERRYH